MEKQNTRSQCIFPDFTSFEVISTKPTDSGYTFVRYADPETHSTQELWVPSEFIVASNTQASEHSTTDLQKSIPPQKYELKASGSAIEVTAHLLGEEELGQVENYCQQEGIDPTDDLGNPEEFISGYDRFETNMWQSSIVPLVGGVSLKLQDSKGENIIDFGDISKLKVAGEHNYEAESGKNILGAFEEYRGTPSVWVLETCEKPTVGNFKFITGKITVGSETFEFISSVTFKGRELEKDYDKEELDSRAFYSNLV